MILALLPGVSSHTSVVSLSGRRIKFRQGFLLEKRKDKFKKVSFSIYCHANEPQYRWHPGERLTRLMTMVQVFGFFIVFWTISSRK